MGLYKMSYVFSAIFQLTFAAIFKPFLAYVAKKMLVQERVFFLVESTILSFLRARPFQGVAVAKVFGGTTSS
jgi:hypothetical protein